MPEDQKSGFSEAVETGASAAHTIRGAIKTGKAICKSRAVFFKLIQAVTFRLVGQQNQTTP